MDENSKDVVVLVGKRVLKEAKAEFSQFTECSPVYIALALSGLLWASWIGIFLLIIVYFGYLAYQEYKAVELEILFDVESAKRDESPVESAPVQPSETAEEVKPTDKQ
ncbi:hypothetical protein XbC2_577 [Xanthomonas phage XbC2]|nr:hypothetical protein XbC2_577 [Xanthomonas phage XbC2]